MKKILAITLALTLAFSAVALPAVEGGVTFNNGISASAEDDVLVSGDYEYVIQEDGTVAIIKYTGNETNVEIPEKEELISSCFLMFCTAKLKRARSRC